MPSKRRPFLGTLQAIESLGMQALEIPSDPETGLSLEALTLALDRWPVKTVVTVSNFSNPTGSLMPDSHKSKLVKLLAVRDIPLIEDDIYGDLAHGRERPRACKAYDRSDNVLLCSSFSKSIAPGYRVGWIVPGRWRKHVEHLKYVSTMANATLTQLPVADYLADSRYERHLARMRRTSADNLARMLIAINRYFPAGTRTSRPTGGFALARTAGRPRQHGLVRPGAGRRYQFHAGPAVIAAGEIRQLSAPGGGVAVGCAGGGGAGGVGGAGGARLSPRLRFRQGVDQVDHELHVFLLDGLPGRDVQALQDVATEGIAAQIEQCVLQSFAFLGQMWTDQKNVLHIVDLAAHQYFERGAQGDREAVVDVGQDEADVGDAFRQVAGDQRVAADARFVNDVGIG